MQVFNMSTIDKTTFENDRPVPQATDVRSGWNFGLDESRQRDVQIYPIYTFGQAQAWSEHFHQRAMDEKLLRARNYLRRLRERRAGGNNVVQIVND